MIAFDLECANGHSFECWFEDSSSFEHQKKMGMVSCPYCDSSDVIKLMSTFTTKRVSSKTRNDANNIKVMFSKLKNYVDSNFDDVGTNFTKEALKMHYGVVKRRNIKGVSSPEEEKIMNAEGVKFFRLPFSSKQNDQN